ncbi:MAG: hypothetical protein RRY29_11165 [Desulfovibrionaceae bacterium]
MVTGFADFYQTHFELFMLIIRIIMLLVCYNLSRGIALRQGIQHAGSITAMLLAGYCILVYISMTGVLIPYTAIFISYFTKTRLIDFLFLPYLCLFLPLVLTYVYFSNRNAPGTPPYAFFIIRTAMVAFFFDAVVLIVVLGISLRT